MTTSNPKDAKNAARCWVTVMLADKASNDRQTSQKAGMRSAIARGTPDRTAALPPTSDAASAPYGASPISEGRDLKRKRAARTTRTANIRPSAT